MLCCFVVEITGGSISSCEANLFFFLSSLYNFYSEFYNEANLQYVLGDVRWTQEKEIIVIDKAYVV